MTSTTITELNALLVARGYTTKVVDDAILVVPVTTVSYRNPAGSAAAMICLNLNKEQRCLQLALPWAFDGTKAVHKDALHRFLFEASKAAPLVKALLDPNDGEVRLRIDLSVGADGVRDDDVVRGVELLCACAEEWHQPITSAMASGTFASPLPPALKPDLRPVGRLEQIARRAGGVNRLRVLFELNKRSKRDPNHPQENDDGHNPR